MPITRSAKKALRQSIHRKARNLQKKRAYKGVITDIRKVTTESMDAMTSKLPTLYKALDKAAKTNVIKKNKADRLKSRLTKLIASKKAS